MKGAKSICSIPIRTQSKLQQNNPTIIVPIPGATIFIKKIIHANRQGTFGTDPLQSSQHMKTIEIKL